MLETVLGVFTSGGVGALVGLFGSAYTKWIEFKTFERKQRFQLDLAEIKLKEIELEQKHALAVVDKNIELSRAEGEIARDVAEMAAFTESQKQNVARYGGLVDKIRGLMRPFITIYLLLVVTLITYLVWGVVGGLNSMSTDQLHALFVYLVQSAVFLSMTSVTWWFGTRPSEWRKQKV